jgi:hypothetical protein
VPRHDTPATSLLPGALSRLADCRACSGPAALEPRALAVRRPVGEDAASLQAYIVRELLDITRMKQTGDAHLDLTSAVTL